MPSRSLLVYSFTGFLFFYFIFFLVFFSVRRRCRRYRYGCLIEMVALRESSVRLVGWLWPLDEGEFGGDVMGEL